MSDQHVDCPAHPLPNHPDVLRSLLEEADRYISNMKNWLPRLEPHLVDGDTPRANALLAALEPRYARVMDHWEETRIKERIASAERLKWDASDVGFPPRLKPYISGPGDQHRFLEDLREEFELIHHRVRELAKTEDRGHPAYQRAFPFALLELNVGKVEKLRDRIAAKLDEPSRNPTPAGAGVENPPADPAQPSPPADALGDRPESRDRKVPLTLDDRATALLTRWMKEKRPKMSQRSLAEALGCHHSSLKGCPTFQQLWALNQGQARQGIRDRRTGNVDAVVDDEDGDED